MVVTPQDGGDVSGWWWCLRITTQR